jgi:alpha-tubulin suppressor-like RCC1 family protein
MSHTLLLDNTGQLWACGRNQFGQLGTGNYNPISTFISVGSGFSKIATGAWSSYAIKTNGDLYVWGDNSYGQLGITNGFGSIAVPTLVPNVSNVSAVAAGWYHSLIIK